jgi:purine-cytosine permease-like protein
LEHFVFRRGKYNVDDWNTPGKLPIGWAAIVSMAIGLVGVVLGAAQVVTISGTDHPVVGPIANLVNPPFGMDVGFELGLVLAGIAYLILRRVELNISKR